MIKIFCELYEPQVLATVGAEALKYSKAAPEKLYLV